MTEHTGVGREAKLGRKCRHNTNRKIARKRTCGTRRHCPVAMMLYKLLLNTDSTEGHEEEELGGNNLKCYLFPEGLS